MVLISWNSIVGAPSRISRNRPGLFPKRVLHGCLFKSPFLSHGALFKETRLKNEFTISRQNVFIIAFFVLLAGLLSLLFSLLEPFLRSFIWATIMVMVFYPVYS